MHKQIILSFCFILGLLYFKSLDTYKLWYKQKIKEGYKEIEEVKKQENYLDISFRKDMRFGGMYHQWESFKKYIDTNTKGDTTRNFVLIPANEYFSSNNSQITFAEPSVVYFLSGLQVVLPYTDISKKANWVALVENGNFNLKKIESDSMRNRFIEMYKQYKFTY